MTYSVFSDFISITMYYLATHALEAIDKSFFTFGYLKVLLLLVLMSFIAFKVIDKKKVANKKNPFIKPMGYSVGLILLLSGCYNLNYYLLPAYEKSGLNYKLDNPKYVYDSLMNKPLTIKTFGLFTHYFNEINKLFIHKQEANIQETRNYFIDSPFNRENSHTGINKGDNLIMFLMESLEWFAIDPELTPTLYKLANEGIAYREYYSKNKTNNSENISIMGNYPNNEGLLLDIKSVERYSKESFPFSLPNMLKKDGVDITAFFHGHNGRFYFRNATMPKYGFDKTVFLEDMDLPDKAMEFDNWNKDSDIIKTKIHDIAPNDGKRFFSFYTTITTHGLYQENPRLKSYYEKLEQLKPNLKKENPHLFYYQAAVMDLDDGLSYLIRYLEENQLMDKTMLVLYSDHYAFYQGLSKQVKGIAPEDLSNIEAHRVPMIMYSKKVAGGVNTNFTSSYNIVPTILDLMGIKYQTNYYSGTSVFSDNIKDNLFVSKLGSLFDRRIFSFDGSEFISTSGEELTPEQIADFQRRVSIWYSKQEQIDKIYQFDIFNSQNQQ